MPFKSPFSIHFPCFWKASHITLSFSICIILLHFHSASSDLSIAFFPFICGYLFLSFCAVLPMNSNVAILLLVFSFCQYSFYASESFIFPCTKRQNAIQRRQKQKSSLCNAYLWATHNMVCSNIPRQR